jgi:mannitol 2-dehydrogenase
MNLGGSRDWGICGVGLMPGDVDMKAALEAQDCLYIVLVKFPDGTVSARVVGS